MATARVMAVFQGASLLPEDRYINVFHFHEVGVESWETYAFECNNAVDRFYSEDFGQGPLSRLLSPYVVRLYQTMAYDLEQPVGSRDPFINEWTLPSALGNGMPEEVAIAVTLLGAPPTNPRRRGRLFFGPLSEACVAAGTSSSPARVEPPPNSVINSLQLSCTFLATQVDVSWCIRSTVPTENFVPIVSGWVDNALDTQRRRGADPTNRYLWSAE